MKDVIRAIMILLAGGGLCIAAPSGARSGESIATLEGQAPVALTGRVNDFAAVLAADQRATLADHLAHAESRTGHPIVIATVNNLDGKDIASYARDLGNHAAIGSKSGNKGIVILLAPNEQLVRIAVGRGLEAVLTDAVCQQIIDEVMLPQFREGKLFDGLSGAISAIDAKL